jgi:hypothetical protein
VFAALKVITGFVIACGSVIAAIVESGRPALCACFFAAFVAGVLAYYAFLSRRNRTVRTLLR